MNQTCRRFTWIDPVSIKTSVRDSVTHIHEKKGMESMQRRTLLLIVVLLLALGTLVVIGALGLVVARRPNR